MKFRKFCINQLSLLSIRFLKCLLRIYKTLISPLLGPRCRFLPSCSDYASESLSSHGIRRGFVLILTRLLQCHPWGKSGYDPVPNFFDLSCPEKIKSATRKPSISKELIT